MIPAGEGTSTKIFAGIAETRGKPATPAGGGFYLAANLKITFRGKYGNLEGNRDIRRRQQVLCEKKP